ncbi:MAG: glycosyltransferase family 2 protein [Lachnospiraceae bacterium]|nr:glycosyltransferase family 2 protein [Lachnospiraceae bacterium]
MNNSDKNSQLTHTFAICAYKESEYLETLIRSLFCQTKKTNIILVTSTPNDYISELCEKYRIPMFVNEGERGITQDWNFAYKCADSDMVTIAHQDDIYGKRYVETLYKEASKFKKPIIFFTDYLEKRNGEYVKNNLNLWIKRIMLFPFKSDRLKKSVFVRRRILSFGSPICCPSVTFFKNNCPEVIFENHFRSDEDWEAWEKLSRLPGAFIYADRILMCHRIHEESETTKIIGDNKRSDEDYEMFKKFWPTPIAKGINKIYSLSEKSNKL